MPNHLTNKQNAFIIEYLKDFNAAGAARRAGYKGGPSTLASVGRKNLAKPSIRRRINQVLDEWAMPASEVLQRLSRHARGTMSDFVTETPDGRVKIDLLKALRTGAMDQVKYLVFDERRNQGGRTHRRVEISLYDSLTALTQLARGYTLPSGTLADTIHNTAFLDDGNGGGEKDRTLDEMHQWEKGASDQGREWLLRTYDDIQSGIIAECQQLFGDAYQPSEDFINSAVEFFTGPSEQPKTFISTEIWEQDDP